MTRRIFLSINLGLFAANVAAAEADQMRVKAGRVDKNPDAFKTGRLFKRINQYER